MLHTITYVSASRNLLTAEELLSLLARSRNANAAHGITGMLLYRDGSFIQTIEGPETAVRALYQKILADPLHHNVIKIFDEAIALREFPSWSMGFTGLGHEQTAHLAGYTDFLTRKMDEKDIRDASDAQQMLYHFRANTG